LVKSTNFEGMAKPAPLIGSASIFLDAVERASAAAALNRPVLVIGERGTGKELIAERLHRLSPRWGGPLVSLNCAALPENLIDAELFGYEAGAFTGAARARAGRFEDADGGTLFLDEIATLSPAAQERLLRVVEYGELTRIGSNRAIAVDVRLVFVPICSTGCRSKLSLCRPCANAARTSKCWRCISPGAWPPNSAGRASRALPTRRWRCSKAMAGQAMSAN
jgi:transcriptional regulator with AAA-type ATPase domain